MTDQERAADRPVTLRDLAEVFGCMWNAAMSTAHQQQRGMDFACILAEGFSAMTVRLEELAAARQAPAPVVTDEMVEAAAREIYDRFDYSGPGSRPVWVEKGNSIKQDDARWTARSALRAALEAARKKAPSP